MTILTPLNGLTRHLYFFGKVRNCTGRRNQSFDTRHPVCMQSECLKSSENVSDQEIFFESTYCMYWSKQQYNLSLKANNLPKGEKVQGFHMCFVTIETLVKLYTSQRLQKVQDRKLDRCCQVSLSRVHKKESCTVVSKSCTAVSKSCSVISQESMCILLINMKTSQHHNLTNIKISHHHHHL